MDIGEINSGEKETWVIPNISTIHNFRSFEIEQLEATGTDIYNSFGYGTHVMNSNELNIKELYDLTNFDLFFVGYSEIENNELVEYQYDQTKAPIPIELGIEFTSVVKLEDSENSSNYVEYTDTYNVIGQGTLKTYDDGDAEAMKMIYKEETREYINNVEVSYEERYEIVFYSKKGHYVTADITDPWNSEGSVTIQNLGYQKLVGKTASVYDNNFSSMKAFPNPIKPGHLLTIESQISLLDHKIDLYNINAQKIATLIFNEKNNNQYEVSIPEKLASGLYFYKVFDKDGGFVNNGKIQIQ